MVHQREVNTGVTGFRSWPSDGLAAGASSSTEHRRGHGTTAIVRVEAPAGPGIGEPRGRIGHADHLGVPSGSSTCLHPHPPRTVEGVLGAAGGSFDAVRPTVSRASAIAWFGEGASGTPWPGARGPRRPRRAAGWPTSGTS